MMEGSAQPEARSNGPSAVPSSPVDSPVSPPLSLQEPTEEEQSSLTSVIQMWIQFAKSFAVIFPIYVLGYFEFSFSWVLIGLAMFFYWRKHYGKRDYRINRALAYLEHEDKVVKRSFPTTEMPPWVHYPDVERVEWLNKTVKQMWPFICQFVDKLFRETIEPAVKGANPHLSSFCFTKIDMGDKPLRVNGVKVYTENVDKRQVIMDLQISFVGNTEIDVDIKKYYCRAGIKSIQLYGTLRVVMEPLLGDMPLIGALSVFFLQKPILDINWTGLTNVLDIPGVDGLCDGIIQDIIHGYLVMPNQINIPLVGEAELSRIRFPIPKAVLRIHFIEAQELMSKDRMLGGLIKGKSDPYGIIQVGTELFQSKTINESLNPKWNEVYEALIYDNMPSEVSFELFDKDNNQDDFLGSLSLDMVELQKEQMVDQWFPLDGARTGKLHLKLEWLSLLPTPDKLPQAMADIRADRGHANDGLSSAVLIIFLDSAKNLPRNPLEFNPAEPRKVSVSEAIKAKKVTSDPNPFVQFTVGHKSFESKTKYKTIQPLWEENFTFLIHNPKTQELEVEVKDAKHECSMGTITVPLSRLVEAKNMMLNEHFPIKNQGPCSTVKMKMALRVLCLEKDTSSIRSSSPSSVQVRKSSSSGPMPRPSVSSDSAKPTPNNSSFHRSASVSAQDQQREPSSSTDYKDSGPGLMGKGGLAENGRSTSNLALSGSQLYLADGKEATPSIASDISNPYATQELQQRLQQLYNGSGPSHPPLGEVKLTIRYSTQRSKLVVIVHSCRNLISFTDHGTDPYVRLYLLPDKRRSSRRKTNTTKKSLSPVYDKSCEFDVSFAELHRRTLDVAVKNGGSLLSKHRGNLLGKVLVDLNFEELTKGLTLWYELSDNGQVNKTRHT
ncbi:extended synaptotagmin-2 isoform X3 [Oryzias melastigma]|uniref:Extended synaptotagmin-like protein 2a n=1 Tax=Oryzias melastigma TaxID=30732 RepID=A0A3B3C5V5_ORYME|nr:extended synaptotagmin-2 isoform X3 [Oryzias melastigma]